jgi:serine/threonine protein kinase
MSYYQRIVDELCTINNTVLTHSHTHNHTHYITAGGSSRHEHKQKASKQRDGGATSNDDDDDNHSNAGSDASQSAPAALCTAVAAAVKASSSPTSSTNHSTNSTNNSSRGASPQQLSPRSPASPRPALHTATTFVGTVTYMSPERINGEAYSYSSDVWSLGLSLLTTALGKLPLDTKGGYWSVLHAIRDTEPPCLPLSQQWWSPEIRSFIDACLTKDPRMRPDCAALLLHPFVRGVPDKVCWCHLSTFHKASNGSKRKVNTVYTAMHVCVYSQCAVRSVMLF